MLAATRTLYKNAFTGLSKSTWSLTLVMLINRSGTMVVPFMTIYCTQQLHFTLTQAGFVMALFGVGAIVGSFIGGRITDAWGFYPVQVAALLLGGAMFIVIGYLKTYPLLCIGTFLLSLCNESFRPANATAIAHFSTPENRTRSYSLNRLAINLGWCVGGVLGGFLASVNYRLLFWVDGCTNFCAALILLKSLPYVKSGYKKTETLKPAGNSAWRDKPYIAFIILTILFATSFFELFTMQPVFFKTEWHLNEQFIGVLMALNGVIIVILEMILIFSLEKKNKPLFYMRIGFFLTGISFVLLVFHASALVAVFSVIIVTIGEMLSMPFMNTFWISRSNESNRGQYAALYSIAWSVAQIAAPAFGGQVAMYSGFNTLWWILFSLCSVAAFGILLLDRSVNKRT